MNIFSLNNVKPALVDNQGKRMVIVMSSVFFPSLLIPTNLVYNFFK